MSKEKKERKKFLVNELIRYENIMNELEAGTEEYEKVKKDYLEIYKELYSCRSLWDKTIDILKIVLPIGASIGLGIYAYHEENDKLNSKNGTTFNLAMKNLKN